MKKNYNCINSKRVINLLCLLCTVIIQTSWIEISRQQSDPICSWFCSSKISGFPSSLVCTWWCILWPVMWLGMLYKDFRASIWQDVMSGMLWHSSETMCGCNILSNFMVYLWYGVRFRCSAQISGCPSIRCVVLDILHIL